MSTDEKNMELVKTLVMHEIHKIAYIGILEIHSKSLRAAADFDYQIQSLLEFCVILLLLFLYVLLPDPYCK